MYVPLNIPPGVIRPGTVYDARGRWYDTNLVRWFNGVMEPVGGWQGLNVSATDAQADVGGPARGMLAWRANDNQPYLALGTPTKLYTYTSGALTDITPASGFTTGGADATQSTGAYGSGTYGSGLYGSGDSSQVTITEAQTWQLDTFGEDLVACAYSDGNIWYWDRSAGGTASPLTNAPTSSVTGVVVTPERFVVALGVISDGAGGWTAEGRGLTWSDQEDATTWTAAAANQSGDFTLAGTGRLLAGHRTRSETLLWTDTGLWAMRYVGGDYVYTFVELGSGCGAISRRSMATIGSSAVWMGHRNFYVYDGGVQQTLPSPISDYVFSNMNRVQASKIWADVRSDYSEVVFYYPSASSTEIDSYVAFNLKENIWYIGSLDRVGGVDRGAFQYPIACDSNGKVYEHDVGTSYLDTDGTTSLVPYATSGPIEIGNGDRLFSIRQIIPDEKTLGDVDIYLYSANYPTATETTNGPYTPANPTSVRITARQVRVEAKQSSAGWRLGTLRLEGVLSGLR